MNKWIKNNINIIIGVFLLLGPLLDLLTGLCIHQLHTNITIGVIIRFIFLTFICLVVIFIFKKKKLIVPYLIIGIYFLFYILGIIIYKDGVGLFTEIQNLGKVFYFPTLFVSLYSLKEELRISKKTLFTILVTYLVLIFIPLMLNVGYKTYEITKEGTLGFFNSANEISGIISLLTPVLFIIMVKSKKIIPKIITAIMYLVVILTIGTKTPLLTLFLTIGFGIIYLWIYYFKTRAYKKIAISGLIIIVAITIILLIIPKTNFYKNIETHLKFLGVKNVEEIMSDEDLIDHFIFSQRLTFLHNKAIIFKESNTYQKIFGIGYLKDGDEIKSIEMDYFDIYYSHGVAGFLIFFYLTLYMLYKVLEKEEKLTLERYMMQVSLLLIIFLSFFTGHILTSPSVSLITIIIILSLTHHSKRDLLFANKELEGGLVSLLNTIDYTNNKVTLIVEKTDKDQIKRLNKHINLRKRHYNLFKLTLFKILQDNIYDISFCYRKEKNYCKISEIASSNNILIIHEKETTIEKESYKKIAFLSKELKKKYLIKNKGLKEKSILFDKKLTEEKLGEILE